jgi:hypothetical protein
VNCDHFEQFGWRQTGVGSDRIFHEISHWGKSGELTPHGVLFLLYA